MDKVDRVNNDYTPDCNYDYDYDNNYGYDCKRNMIRQISAH